MNIVEGLIRSDSHDQQRKLDSAGARQTYDGDAAIAYMEHVQSMPLSRVPAYRVFCGVGRLAERGTELRCGRRDRFPVLPRLRAVGGSPPGSVRQSVTA